MFVLNLIIDINTYIQSLYLSHADIWCECQVVNNIVFGFIANLSKMDSKIWYTPNFIVLTQHLDSFSECLKK